MVHIPQDRRAQRSAERIYEGLMACLEEKSFDQVSVSDVQRASGVGRSTFYRLFDNLSDVLMYRCEAIFEQADPMLLHSKSPTAEETQLRFIALWMENKPLVRALAASGRMNYIQNAHRKYFATQILSYFPDCESDPEQKEFLLSLISALVGVVMENWVRTGTRENAAQLHARLNQCGRWIGEAFRESGWEQNENPTR